MLIRTKNGIQCCTLGKAEGNGGERQARSVLGFSVLPEEGLSGEADHGQALPST